MLLRRFMQHVKDQNWFAVGLDVVVVIVGIFLGMQVQQLYQSKSDRDNEKLLLKELTISLQNDLDIFERAYFYRLEIKEVTLNKLYQLVENKAELTDEEFMSVYIAGMSSNIWYTGIGHDFYMLYDDGPYESLKSLGIQIISNPELRSILVDYYETRLPRQTYFINSSVDNSRANIHSLREKLFRIDRVEFEDGKPINKYLPRVENILSNENFWKLLELERRKALNQRRLDGIKKDHEELIRAINEEIIRLD